MMPSLTETVRIVNRRGLHARAAAKFSKLASQYKCDIDVTRADVIAPGNIRANTWNVFMHILTSPRKP
jgi:phosphotransferase system HPr (HPr) family protein